MPDSRSSSPLSSRDAHLESAILIHRRVLVAHAYRMLGSLSDAEDAVQAACLRAWTKRHTLREPGQVRPWLFSIVTRVCLSTRRSRRLPEDVTRAAGSDSLLEPEPRPDLPWMEPIPDEILASCDADPLERVLRTETLSLAFIALLQRLSARERAALLLADVLSWSTTDVSTFLGITPAALYSMLGRARKRVRARRTKGQLSAKQRELLRDFQSAWERRDLDDLSALLREDVRVNMPPDSLWFDDRRIFLKFLSSGLFATDVAIELTLHATAANGQPAFLIRRRNRERRWEVLALLVLTLARSRVSAITGFMDARVLSRFSRG